jgi:hypothetical protein
MDTLNPPTIEQLLEGIVRVLEMTEERLYQLAIDEAFLQAEPTPERIWEVLNSHDPRGESQRTGESPS